MRINELMAQSLEKVKFLSIQAQDFIEDSAFNPPARKKRKFLSIQAQDFIED